jgi:predicted enzyme related to lactoylglutathione lyase
MTVNNTKFAHVNIIAKDWEMLAHFYEKVFGCERLQPERNLSGPWLEHATGIKNARINGVHLRLPGQSKDGATLEIFQYNTKSTATKKMSNEIGLRHLAFVVADVEAAKTSVIDAGGRMIGEVVTPFIPGVGIMEFVYAADPEGNLLELQKKR